MKIKIEIEYTTLYGPTSTFENFSGIRGACDWIEDVGGTAIIEEAKVEQQEIDVAEKEEQMASDVEPDAYIEKKSEEGIM